MENNEGKEVVLGRTQAVSCGTVCAEDSTLPQNSLGAQAPSPSQKASGPPGKAERGLICPVCMEKPKHPFAGKCGHVACHVCWQVAALNYPISHNRSYAILNSFSQECIQRKMECPVCRYAATVSASATQPNNFSSPNPLPQTENQTKAPDEAIFSRIEASFPKHDVVACSSQLNRRLAGPNKYIYTEVQEQDVALKSSCHYSPSSAIHFEQSQRKP